MKLVIVESPYAGNITLNVAYARACLFDCLLRGEAPLASHLLYTQVLDDKDPAERARGIDAGLAWAEKADLTVLYIDLGVSSGMKIGLANAIKAGRPYEERRLPNSQHALQVFGVGIDDEIKKNFVSG